MHSSDASGPRDAAHDRLPASTYLLVLGQAINLTAAVLSVSIAALVGSRLAPSPAWGTIPYGAQFAAVMLCTYPASMLMKRFGRRRAFCMGAAFLVASGVVGYEAVERQSFGGLLASHFLLGLYVAFANFYRFAAIDRLEGALRAKGMSLVVAGGVLAAFAGPLLATRLQNVSQHREFALCYAAFIGLGIATWVLMGFWRPGAADVAVPAATASADASAAAPIRLVWTLPIAAAVFSAAAGYLLMNLLMVQAELAMKDLCVSFADGAMAIQAHVLAMFAPSFLTGALIGRLGLRCALIAGFVLLAASMLLGVFFFSYDAMLPGLVLLGLGWNLTYIGGGALLARSVPDETRHRWQGLNDSLIAVSATVGALLPSLMQTALGWRGSNLGSLLLCLCGMPLCWKALTHPSTVSPATGVHHVAK